ncbi:MAG: hypothetical protein RL152_1408, partial [Bacteroidota bacterium]
QAQVIFQIIFIKKDFVLITKPLSLQPEIDGNTSV